MRILIAVIAYNEEKNIIRVLQDLIDNNKLGYNIVVIDNGSVDATCELTKEYGIDVIRHCINTGSSFGTVMTYLNYAYLNDYDIVVQFDGDGQHYAKELDKIINPIINNKADYVIGSRFIEKTGFQSTGLRRIGIKFFSLIISIIIRKKITDITSGARAYNKNVIKIFAKYYPHEIFNTSQLLLISYYAGAKVLEVPIVMKERIYGNSEYSPLFTVRFILIELINIIGIIIQKNKLKRNGFKN